MQETAELYASVTKPKVIEPLNTPEAKEWIYNVLDGKKEVDLRIFADDQFILSKDWEFNDGDPQTFYALAMPMRRDLLTLRDLDRSHLDLLKHIRQKSLQAIEEKHGLKSSQLRVFFHYLPTYFHLHVHFLHVNMVAKHSC